MLQNFRKNRHISAMETETILKNEASLKSQMSKRNRPNLLFFCLFSCLLFVGTFSAYAQQARPRIAIIHLQDNGSQRNITELMSIMTTDLVNTNRFRVVERARVEQIIQEQRFQTTQMTSAQVARVGQILGVDKIITGEVSRYSVSVRLVDAQSGEIERAFTLNRTDTPRVANHRSVAGRSEVFHTYPFFSKNSYVAERLIRNLLRGR